MSRYLTLEAPSTGLRRGQAAVVFLALFLLILVGAGAAPSAAALPIIAAVILGTLIVALTDLWLGVLATVATVALLPTPFSLDVGGATLTVGRLVLFALLAGWLMQRHREGAVGDERATPMDLFFWVLTAALVAAMIANVPRLHTSELAGSVRRISVFVVDFFLFYRVVYLALRNRDRALRFLRFVAGLIGVIAALGLVEWATGSNVFEFLSPLLPRRLNHTIAQLADASVLQRGSISRVHSTLEHPLALAVLLLIGLPLAASFALGAKERAPRVRWLLTTLVISTALLFTASRGAYLILVPTFLTMLVLSPDRRARVGIVSATVGFVCLGLLSPSVRTTMTYHLFNLTSEDRRGGSIEHRTSAYSATIDLLGDRPFFGFGPGTFTAQGLKENNLLSESLDVPVLDNGYLEIAAESGVVGLVALSGTLFASWLMTVRVWRSSTTRQDRLLAAALVAVVQAWILFAFFADVYGYNAPPRVFFAILAAAAALRTVGPPAPSPVRRAAVVAGA